MGTPVGTAVLRDLVAELITFDETWLVALTVPDGTVTIIVFSKSSSATVDEAFEVLEGGLEEVVVVGF